MIHYIYKITNLINGKYYIGKHAFKRLNNTYLGSGKLLHKAIEKYGVENFKKEILEINFDRDTNAKREKEIIGDLWILNECYNLKPGGPGGFNMTGRNHSEESKILISENRKGRIPWNKGMTFFNSPPKSEEHKAKISASNFGKPKSAEHREKLRLAQTGKKLSEETRQKMRDAAARRKAALWSTQTST